MSGGVERLRLRQKVKAEIAGCQNCGLYKGCTQPVSYYGPPNAKIAVVGEAPGKHEDIHNRPFVGPAGDKIRTYLRDSGIAPESVAWLNVVCCFPGRTPLRAEVDACNGNLRGQLAAISPEFVLVLGGVASQAFHPSLRISEIRGLWWRVGLLPTQPWAMATWHPAAVLRKPSLESEARSDIQFFRLVSSGELPAPVNDKCVKCRAEYPEHYWQDLGWCQRCWATRLGKAGRGRPIEKDGDKRRKGKLEWEEPQLQL